MTLMLVALFTLCAALLDSEAEADALSLSEGSDDADELASSLAEEEDSAEEDDDSAALEEAVELAAVLELCELSAEDQGSLRLLILPENNPQANKPISAATTSTTT
jgi:hypothetical protein